MPRRSRVTINTRAFMRDLKKVQRQVNAIRREIPKAANRAMGAEAKQILAEAKRRVPVETGKLRSSGRVSEVRKASGTEFQVTFGNEEVDYAVAVHERVDLKHDRGESKFLHNARQRMVPGMARRIGSRLEDAIRRMLRKAR